MQRIVFPNYSFFIFPGTFIQHRGHSITTPTMSAGPSEAKLITEDIGSFDPASKAVVRPLWELHKRGEIMAERDFHKKYAHFSMPRLRDSYHQAVIGRYNDFCATATTRR